MQREKASNEPKASCKIARLMDANQLSLASSQDPPAWNLTQVLFTCPVQNGHGGHGGHGRLRERGGGRGEAPGLRGGPALLRGVDGQHLPREARSGSCFETTFQETAQALWNALNAD